MKIKTIILGLAIIIINICCASSVFEPTPFQNWNESSKRVDRVNLWPLFYYQDPNMSVLWPMIDKRDDGHAFRPLYSVYDRGDELNILWPLSSFDFKRKEYRIGNVYYEKLDKLDNLMIFPISYFDFKSHEYWGLNTYKSKEKFVFFPMYFYEKNDHWCATFIAGKGKDWYSIMPPLWISSCNTTNHNNWFFGPLGMYNSNENGCHKFWALFKVIDYESYKDSKELNILFLNNYLMSKNFREINFFYLSRYTKTKKDEEFYFFPFVNTYSSSNKKEKVIFPLYFSKKNKKKDYQLLIPLFYKSKSDKSNILITPLCSAVYNNNSQRIITPLISFKKGGDKTFMNIMGLIYNHIENKKEKYSKTNVIWPLFNYTRNKDKKSISLLPLFYKSSSSNKNVLITPVCATIGDKKNKTILTPIISFSRDENTKFINGLGLFYNHYVNQKKDYRRTDIIWPLFNYTHNKDKKSVSLLPLFYKSSNSNKNVLITPVCATIGDKKNKTILTPIISFSRNENTKFINGLGLFYNQYVNQKNDYRRTDIIWPLFNYTHNKDKKSISLLPLFYKSNSSNKNVLITPVCITTGNKKKKTIFTPLISFGNDENTKFINSLGFVYNNFTSQKKDYRRTDIIWPLFNHTYEKEKTKTYLIPLFCLNKFKNKFSFYSPIISYGESYKNENKFLNIAGIAFHYNKTENETRGGVLWPLYEYSFNKNGSSSHSFLLDFVKKRKTIKKRQYYDGAIDNTETLTQKVTKTFILENFKAGIRCEKVGFPIPQKLRGKNGCLSRTKIKENEEVWKDYAKKNWWIQKYTKATIPLLFSYKWYEKSYSHFDIFCWLYESDWNAAYRNKPEKVERKILWWIMNYNRKGENVSLDVFPFITYDKLPKEEISQFSVFWRLFRWREEKEKRMLDILFIPLRWVGNP